MCGAHAVHTPRLQQQQKAHERQPGTQRIEDVVHHKHLIWQVPGTFGVGVGMHTCACTWHVHAHAHAHAHAHVHAHARVHVHVHAHAHVAHVHVHVHVQDCLPFVTVGVNVQGPVQA